MSKVGFVGLGTMGAPMAGHLISKRFETIVWNRTASRCGPLVEQGATQASDLRSLAAECNVVLICVTGTEDVRSCLAEMAPAADPETLFVDHSTIAPDAAREIHSDFRFLDAPITGGSKGAQSGSLTTFVGGTKENFDIALPYMRAYCAKAELVGGPGAGQTMKMANQIAVAGSLLGLCESLAFATRAGLDLKQTRKLLSGGAAGSWAFDNYGPMIIAEDWSPGFTIANQRKDFAYATEAAGQIGAQVPGTELVDKLLAKLQEQGGGEQTTAALYSLLLGNPSTNPDSGRSRRK